MRTRALVFVLTATLVLSPTGNALPTYLRWSRPNTFGRMSPMLLVQAGIHARTYQRTQDPGDLFQTSAALAEAASERDAYVVDDHNSEAVLLWPTLSSLSVAVLEPSHQAHALNIVERLANDLRQTRRALDRMTGSHLVRRGHLNGSEEALCAVSARPASGRGAVGRFTGSTVVEREDAESQCGDPAAALCGRGAAGIP